MRTSTVVTISLPPKMALQARRFAKKEQMTNSEFIRMAVRRIIEELSADEAVRIANYELKTGKTKVLPPGGLAKLMARA